MSIKLYDIAEVTEILKVHRRTVYNYVKDGQLKATKMGKYLRVREEDLQKIVVSLYSKECFVQTQLYNTDRNYSFRY